jgi:hypothetical protein
MESKFTYDASPELAPKPTGTATEKAAPSFETDETGQPVHPYPNSPGITGAHRFGDGRAREEGEPYQSPAAGVGKSFDLRYRDGRMLRVPYPSLTEVFRGGGYIDLTNSILDGQVLELAQCFNRDFSGASLRNCELVGKFSGCSFQGADLRGARLSGSFDCNFSGATLDGADVQGADFSGSTFLGVKLDGLKNKESAIFSYTDVDTRDWATLEVEEEPEEEPEEEEDVFEYDEGEEEGEEA